MSKPQPAPKTHKIEFNHRFGPAILMNGMSRTLRKDKKSIQAIRPGDQMQIILVGEDKKSKQVIGTVPVAETHATQLDRFGMTIQRPGANPYRVSHLQSLAALFGFEKYEHLIEFHQEIDYLNKDEEDTFQGITICWDPSALIAAEAPEPAKAKATGKSSEEPKDPPNLDLDLDKGGAGGGGNGKTETDSKTDDPEKDKEPEIEGPYLVAEMPGNLLAAEFEEEFATDIKAVADTLKAHDLIVKSAEVEEEGGIYCFRDAEGKDIESGPFEKIEEKLTSGANANDE